MRLRRAVKRSMASRYSARRWLRSVTSRALFRRASMRSSHAWVVFKLPESPRRHVWTWWMLPSGSTRPLQPIRNDWNLPSSLSVSAEANSWARRVMLKPTSGHLLDHFTDPPLWRIVDDRHLEAVAAGEARVGQELLGSCHIADGTLPALVVKGAHGRDRRAPRRVLAFPRYLVQRLAVDAVVERLPDPRVVGQRGAEVAGRVLLSGLVAHVDGDALVAEPGHVRHLEAPLALDGGGVGRRHLVHDGDVAGSQVGQ